MNEYCRRTGDGSSTWDVCIECFDELEENPHAYDAKLTPYNGDPAGSDGRGDNIEHPCYSECDYRCAVCNAKLTEEDN